jgi:hypothetical protein
MLTRKGHLTYCSNIHAGESWQGHFDNLRIHIPVIKEAVSPLQPFGIGLRLSNQASLELHNEEALVQFQQWLHHHNCYVFTMNGFPYGGFHHTIVKDKVHAPDWLSQDRVNYTIRLANILSKLLPEDLDGGISTSPLSYKFWHRPEDHADVVLQATLNLMSVVAELINIKNVTGKHIHIDIEPEPDGLLGDGKEFLDWYVRHLLPIGVPYLQEKFGLIDDVAMSVIKEHVQLCYDICHYSVGYEDHHSMIKHAQALGIKTGKIQISAALKGKFKGDAHQKQQVIDSFSNFNEPVYLHQVVAKQMDAGLIHYPDMPDALADAANPAVTEWRAHYHVPLFVESYGALQSTRSDIEFVMTIHNEEPFTAHLEIETYTWEVLPDEMRLPLSESIIRELVWVLGLIMPDPSKVVNDESYA